MRLVTLLLAGTILLAGCDTFLRLPGSKAVVHLPRELAAECPKPSPLANRSEAAFIAWAKAARLEAKCYQQRRDALVKALEKSMDLRFDGDTK